MKKTILEVTLLMFILVICLLYVLNYTHTKCREITPTDEDGCCDTTGCQYQFVVTDDSLTVYDGSRTVGTVKLEGQLDSLIIEDNE